MKITYIVNLNNYYSKRFNAFYTKKLVVDKDNIMTTVDKFSGYLNYELFNKEDEARAHREARELLQDELDKIICNTDVANNITKAIKIIEENECVETINLKDTIHKVKEYDFILSVSISQ